MDNGTMHEHSCLATKSEKTFLHFFCKNAPLQLASLLWFLNALLLSMSLFDNQLP
uniref:Uncharacterized protein n=1 Tax=Anguilla anguilla TaxID=7936 RepID=A0A0E9U187_ANGAN